jgi:hypothetical protein
MDEPGRSDAETTQPRSKVARLIDRYELDGLGARLEADWTAEGDDRRSLRDLAAVFNRRLLAAALRDADVQTLAADPEPLYRLLTDPDASDADRTQARRQLEREGVDVDALTDDFVSYQAIRSYLTEYRGAEYSPDADRVSTDRTTLERLQGRVEAVTGEKVTQLDRAGHLDVGSFRTLVDVTIICEDCGGQYELSRLLDRGGCDCSEK